MKYLKFLGKLLLQVISFVNCMSAEHIKVIIKTAIITCIYRGFLLLGHFSAYYLILNSLIIPLNSSACLWRERTRCSGALLGPRCGAGPPPGFPFHLPCLTPGPLATWPLGIRSPICQMKKTRFREIRICFTPGYLLFFKEADVN